MGSSIVYIAVDIFKERRVSAFQIMGGTGMNLSVHSKGLSDGRLSSLGSLAKSGDWRKVHPTSLLAVQLHPLIQRPSNSCSI